MTVHLIQRTWSDSTGFGRSEYKTELQPGRGYFTSAEQAQPILDSLNAEYRARHNDRESERASLAAGNGVDVTPIPFEESDFLPRFVLVEVPAAPLTP